MRLNKKRASRCPSCGEKIFLGEQPKVGQYLLCSICDEKVEIIKLDPIVLDLLYEPDSRFMFDDYEIMGKYGKRAKI
jgi:hypothetical protein